MPVLLLIPAGVAPVAPEIADIAGHVYPVVIPNGRFVVLDDRL
ncbi:MAG: hypothetical protein AABN95_18145 [Acidobacteriota bacterium]